MKKTNSSINIDELDTDDIDGYLDDSLCHYGTKRHSGRYPWGSGENPYQHAGNFYTRVMRLENTGKTEADICALIRQENGWGEQEFTTADYRNCKTIARTEMNRQTLNEALKLMNNGMSRNAAAKQLGVNESKIRSLEKEISSAKRKTLDSTVNILKKQVEEKGVIDIGAGVELELGISRTMLDQALYIVEAENKYFTDGIGVKTETGGRGAKETNTKVLCVSEKALQDARNDNGKIGYISDYASEDGGITYHKLSYPASIDSKRIAINYAENGGTKMDGTILLRRGVSDLSLGNSHYAQVRILVDGTHYLKGMALYSDDIPEGKDVVFNTNKKIGTPALGEKDNSVLKPIKNDPINPFGAAIKANGQSTYIDENGERKLSPINKLKEEGDWDTGSSKNLSSQFLSKQPLPLIKTQLNKAYEDKKAEYDSIMELTNPTVKKKLLAEFAESCDSAARYMKAASLPRQATHVILPSKDLKETEVYAPNYKNGEHLVMIRYPHAGTFEIPEVVVNNSMKNREKYGANLKDAVVINSKVAERLSGADFDGDTVVCIPVNDKVKVKTSPQLEKLKGFDPKLEYPRTETSKVMPEDMKQKQMGIISNLITDMHLKGASKDDIARAAMHSMVVIDACKHGLDYERSALDNNIDQLKRTYQMKEDGSYGGASTLLSKRKQTIQVPERKGSAKIDPKTGKLSYDTTNRIYEDEKPVYIKDEKGRYVKDANGDKIPQLNEKGKPLYVKTGKTVLATQKEYLLDETGDLHTLSSGTDQEKLYADYGNALKSLANSARKEYVSTPKLTYSSAASKEYKEEVASLKAKKERAELNRVRERNAMAIANSMLKEQRERAKATTGKDMSKEDASKKFDENKRVAREKVNASGRSTRIVPTDREWEAIQAGAIHDTMLQSMLKYMDADMVREKAMPKDRRSLSDSQINRIKALSARGFTQQEIADSLCVSVSTVKNYL